MSDNKEAPRVLASKVRSFRPRGATRNGSTCSRPTSRSLRLATARPPRRFPTPALDLEGANERAIWFDGYVRTYLERDLQDLQRSARCRTSAG